MEDSIEEVSDMADQKSFTKVSTLHCPINGFFEVISLSRQNFEIGANRAADDSGLGNMRGKILKG